MKWFVKYFVKCFTCQLGSRSTTASLRFNYRELRTAPFVKLSLGMGFRDGVRDGDGVRIGLGLGFGLGLRIE